MYIKHLSSQIGLQSKQKESGGRGRRNASPDEEECEEDDNADPEEPEEMDRDIAGYNGIEEDQPEGK